MCMKLDDITLNYVEKQADGSYQNAETTIPAAMGVMTAFNRIGATWTGGSYALITGILRTEWGFNGAVITDNANTGVFMLGQQMIEAGADMKLTYDTSAARWVITTPTTRKPTITPVRHCTMCCTPRPTPRQ